MLYLYKSNQTKNGVLLSKPYFSTLTEFKSIYTALWMKNYFPPYNHFPHRWNGTSPSLIYYLHGKCSDKLHSLIPPVQTFTAMIHHMMYTGTNNAYSICIPLVRRKFDLDSFSDCYNLSHFISRINCYSFLNILIIYISYCFHLYQYNILTQ